MFFVIHSLRDTNLDIDPETLVDDIANLSVAVPKGHHVGESQPEMNDDRKVEAEVEQSRV